MIALIPTKGRPQTQTHRLFEASGFTVYHFIEPQDAAAYSVSNPIILPQNDQGITYARNFMLDWSREQGFHSFVCCDDDITHFGTAQNGKARKGNAADDLIVPLQVFTKSNAALGGLNQRQFAWNEKKPYRVNTGKVNGCFFLNMRQIGWRYRADTKEDIDFIMQCLDHRRNFLFFGRVFYDTPAIGTNEGGLHQLYAAKRDVDWAHRVRKDWPEYAKIIQQYGRVDVRLDYKRKALDMGLEVI